jgi:DNA polymerase II small subunit/DNA polymerase delta subunit B
MWKPMGIRYVRYLGEIVDGIKIFSEQAIVPWSKNVSDPMKDVSRGLRLD